MKKIISKAGFGVTLALGVMLSMAGILALEGRLDQAKSDLFPSGEKKTAGETLLAEEAKEAAGSLSTLSFFTMAAPFDGHELAKLQEDLIAARKACKQKTLEAQAALAESENLKNSLDARWEEIQRIKGELEQKAETLRIETAELQRDLRAYDQARESAFKKMAKSFTAMQPAKAAESLMSWGSLSDAASIFAQLAEDVQGPILEALSEEQRSEFLREWSRVERSRISQKNAAGGG